MNASMLDKKRACENRAELNAYRSDLGGPEIVRESGEDETEVNICTFVSDWSGGGTGETVVS